jgi:hypothetical protein
MKNTEIFEKVLKILKNIEKYFTKKSIGKVKKFKNFF